MLLYLLKYCFFCQYIALLVKILLYLSRPMVHTMSASGAWHEGVLPWSAGVWLHGEAVAAGTVMAADMSHRLGWIDQDLLDRTRQLLQRAKLPVAPPQVMHQHMPKS